MPQALKPIENRPIEKQAEPEAEPANDAAKQKKPAPFSIQVGAYLTKAYAEDKLAELKQKEYRAFIYETLDKKGRTWYMVRVGRFEERPAAEQFLSEFTARENINAVIAFSKKP